MDKQLQAALLSAMLCRQGQTEITVTGYSMEPTFFEGDRITVARSDSYAVGDILVFTDHGNLLVHRLLEIGECYLCKGDNAFRTESISAEQIFGKVIFVNGRPLEAWPMWKTSLSRRVNAAFCTHDYSIAKTKPTPIYRAYSALVLQKEDPTMKYQNSLKHFRYYPIKELLCTPKNMGFHATMLRFCATIYVMLCFLKVRLSLQRTPKHLQIF